MAIEEERKENEQVKIMLLGRGVLDVFEKLEQNNKLHIGSQRKRQCVST